MRVVFFALLFLTACPAENRVPLGDRVTGRWTAAAPGTSCRHVLELEPPMFAMGLVCDGVDGASGVEMTAGTFELEGALATATATHASCEHVGSGPLRFELELLEGDDTLQLSDVNHTDTLVYERDGAQAAPDGVSGCFDRSGLLEPREMLPVR
jgi:hypothetical protein